MRRDENNVPFDLVVPSTSGCQISLHRQADYAARGVMQLSPLQLRATLAAQGQGGRAPPADRSAGNSKARERFGECGVRARSSRAPRLIIILLYSQRNVRYNT